MEQFLENKSDEEIKKYLTKKLLAYNKVAIIAEDIIEEIQDFLEHKNLKIKGVLEEEEVKNFMKKYKKEYTKEKFDLYFFNNKMFLKITRKFTFYGEKSFSICYPLFVFDNLKNYRRIDWVGLWASPIEEVNSDELIEYKMEIHDLKMKLDRLKKQYPILKESQVMTLKR